MAEEKEWEHEWKIRQGENDAYSILSKELSSSSHSHPFPAKEQIETFLHSLDLVAMERIEDDTDTDDRRVLMTTALLQVLLNSYHSTSLAELIGLIEDGGLGGLWDPQASNDDQHLQEIHLLELIYAQISSSGNPEEKTATFSSLLTFIQKQIGSEIQFHIWDGKMSPTTTMAENKLSSYQASSAEEKEEGEQKKPTHHIVVMETAAGESVFRVIIGRKLLHPTEADYWNDLLFQMTHREEMLTFLNALFAQPSPPFVVDEYVDNKLYSELPSVRSLKEFGHLLLPPEHRRKTPELNFLNALIAEEEWITRSTCYSAEKLSAELKYAYICCIREACNIFYMNKTSAQNDFIEEVRRKKAQLEENIEEGQFQLKKVEEALYLARKKQGEAADKLTRGDQARAELEEKLAGLQCKMALLDFQARLWKVELSYDDVIGGIDKRVQKMGYSRLCKFLVAKYDIEYSTLLEDEHNDTRENVDALRSILDHLHAPHTSVIKKGRKGQTIVEITGKDVALSKILQDTASSSTKMSELRIICGNQLFIDVDLSKETFHGRNVALMANKIEVNAKKGSGRIIDVSGADGLPLETPEKAGNGRFPGFDGFDGNDAQAGESAGNVYIRARTIVNSDKLTVIANGGSGGIGQDGGDGQDGADGNNGDDGKFEGRLGKELTAAINDYNLLSVFSILVALLGDALNSWSKWYDIAPGQKGKHGQRGGNGGRAGLAGGAGERGTIRIVGGVDAVKMVTLAGQNGTDGKNGVGGLGGTGGRDGVDIGWAYQASWCPGWNDFTCAKGKLDVNALPARWFGWRSGGYELLKLKTESEIRSSRAENGQRGTEGEKAEQRSHSRNTPTSKVPIDERELSSSFVQVMAERGQELNLEEEMANVRAQSGHVVEEKLQQAKNHWDVEAELNRAKQDEADGNFLQKNLAEDLSHQNMQMEQQQSQLEKEEAKLAEILSQKDKMMQSIDQAEASVKQQSLQKLEQSTRKAAVLRNPDPTTLLNSKQEPAMQSSCTHTSGPSFIPTPHAGQVVPQEGDNEFGFTAQEIAALEADPRLIEALQQLASTGQGNLRKWTNKVIKRPSTSLLQLLEGCATNPNLNSIEVLTKFCNGAEELKRKTKGCTHRLSQALTTLAASHARKWLETIVTEKNEQLGKIIPHVVERVVTIMEDVKDLMPTSGGMFPICQALYDALSDSEFSNSIQIDQIVTKTVLWLSGFVQPNNRAAAPYFDQLLNFVRVSPSSSFPTLVSLMPHLTFSLEEMEKLKNCALQGQSGLLVANREHRKRYNNLKNLLSSLNARFYSLYGENLAGKLVCRMNSLSSSSSSEDSCPKMLVKLEKLVRSLECPYSHVRLGFKQKQQTYERLLTADHEDALRALAQELSPAGSISRIPQEMAALSGLSDAEAYKQLMKFCDMIYISSNAEQDGLEDLRKIALQLITNGLPSSGTLLVVEGLHQLETVVMTSAAQIVQSKLKGVSSLAKNELEGLLSAAKDVGELVLTLLEPYASSLLRKEEIVHAFYTQLIKLCVGWVHLSSAAQHGGKEEQVITLPNTRKAHEMLKSMEEEIQRLRTECPPQGKVLEELDSILEEEDSCIWSELCPGNEPDISKRLNEHEGELTHHDSQLIQIMALMQPKFSAMEMAGLGSKKTGEKNTKEKEPDGDDVSDVLKKLTDSLNKKEGSKHAKGALAVVSSMLDCDALEYMELLSGKLKNDLGGKHVLCSGVVNSYVELCSSLYTLWTQLQTQVPLFGKPIVDFFHQVWTQCCSLEEKGVLPSDKEVTRFYRSTLSNLFQSGFPEVMELKGTAVAQKCSNLTPLLEVMISSWGESDKPEWVRNAVFILLELVGTFGTDEISRGSELLGLCEKLESLQDLMAGTETQLGNGVREIQTRLVRLSKKRLLLQGQKKKTAGGYNELLKDLMLAEIPLWVAFSPGHPPAFCSLYEKWNEGKSPPQQFDVGTSRGKMAGFIASQPLSPEEEALFARAIDCNAAIKLFPEALDTTTSPPEKGNRFVALFDDKFNTKEKWSGDNQLFTNAEARIISRLREIHFSDWNAIKSIASTYACTEWETRFKEVLFCHQFKQILTPFATSFLQSLEAAGDKAEQLKNLFTKFLNHYDISSSAQNEDLISATTQTLPEHTPDVAAFIKFKFQFNRCLALCGDKLDLNSWLMGAADQIVQSQEPVLLDDVTELLFYSAEQDHHVLHSIMRSAPSESWKGEGLLHILSILYAAWADRLKGSNSSVFPMSQEIFKEKFKEAVAVEKSSGLNAHQRLLTAMIHCLTQESRVANNQFCRAEEDYFQQIFVQISLHHRMEQSLLEKLKTVPLARWVLVLREAAYLKLYSPEMVSVIMRFESKFGALRTKAFIDYIAPLINPANVEILLHKFCSQEWFFDVQLEEELKKICEKHKERKSPEEILKKVMKACEEHTNRVLKAERNVRECVRLMLSEKKNEGIAEMYLTTAAAPSEKNGGKTAKEKKQRPAPRLEEMVNEVREAYKKPSHLCAALCAIPIEKWEKKHVYEWGCNLLVNRKRMSLVTKLSTAVSKLKIRFAKTAFQRSLRLHAAKKITKPDIVAQIRNNLKEVVAVCVRAIELLKGVHLRDTQLIAVLLLLDHVRREKSCLAEVATGEGKTFILAVAVAIKALEGDNVDLVTSSSVLATQSFADVKPFFSLLGINAGVNCDKHAENESVRKGRYQNCVIYGDLGSFQRDILLTEFFGKRMTMGRVAHCVVVDEVDSMLLDKGDNILYLSHNIKELKLLCPLLIAIWEAVHAPDVQLGMPQDMQKVVRYIKQRVAMGDIKYPNYLQGFVHGRLNLWVKNAFLAKTIEEKDAYIVTNLDQKGYRVVLMDKDTGVEQTSMHYSGGLHQFMQLKHGESLTPESLKAVFMSNITYLKRFPGNLMGITGTLGSEMERSLLAQCYDVSFFQIPRFSCRRCIEENAVVVAGEENWLAAIEGAVTASIEKQGAAVLVIAENVKRVETITSRLKTLKCVEAAKICSYVSAFDEDFAAKRKEPLIVGEVVVATNIAGRGMDIRISDALNTAGGLKVILSFLAPNVRIEEQAFGRTARAGNKGSVQYIVDFEATQFTALGTTTSIGILRSARDDSESSRLNEFKQKSLPRIDMEEKLFQKFTQMLHDVEKTLKERARSSAISKEYVQTHLDNLKNRWAIWLDAVADQILAATVTKSDAVFREFEKFKKEMKSCLESGKSGVADGKIMFERGPFEVTCLARLYESVDSLDLATTYFKRVISDEPEFSEIARYYLGAIMLKSCSDLAQRREAMKHLKIARRSLQGNIYRMSAGVQVLQMLGDQARKTQGKGMLVAQGYTTMVQNECEIMQVHIGKINEAIGAALDVHVVKGIEGVFGDDEAGELFEAVCQLGESVVKDYRISRKIKIDPDKKTLLRAKFAFPGEFDDIKWPSTFDYCKDEGIQLLRTVQRSGSRVLQQKQLNPLILTKGKLWDYLRKEGFIGKEETRSILQIQPLSSDDNDKAEKEVENSSKFEQLGGDIPEKFLAYKSNIQTILAKHENEEFTSELFDGIKAPDECVDWFKSALQELNLLLPFEEKSAKVIAANVPFDPVTGEVTNKQLKYSAWVTGVLSGKAESDGKCWQLREEIVQHKIPLPEKEADGSNILWRFLLENEILKQPKINFPLATYTVKGGAEARFKGVENTVKGSKEIDHILNRFHPEQETKPSTESIMKVLKQNVGSLRTYETLKVGYHKLEDYFQSGVYPPEIQDFRDQKFDQVLAIGEYSWWNQWGPCIVALMGVICIIAGVLLTFCTGGVAAFYSRVLIWEGIGDLVYTFQSIRSGHFSWGEYAAYKVISVAFSILTGGLSAWMGAGANVAKVAGATWAAVFTSVGIQVLKECGKAIMFTAADMAVTDMLNKIGEYLIENCRKVVAEKVPQVVGEKYALLSKAFDSVYENSYEKTQPRRSIRECFSKTLMDVKRGIIGSKIYGYASRTASQVAGAMATAAGKLWAVGNQNNLNYRLGEGSNMQTRAGKLENILKWINRIVLIGRILHGLVEMATYAGRVVDELVSQLKSVATNMGATKKRRQEKKEKCVQMKRSEFDEFKIKMRDEISHDIVSYMVKQVQTSMLQPIIQQQVHQLLHKVGDIVARNTGSVFNYFRGKRGGLTAKIGQTVRLSDPSTQSKLGGEGTLDPSKADPQMSVAVLGENNEVLGNISLAQASAKYGDSLQLYTDINGNVVMFRPTFENYVDTFGQGKCEGLLELQACTKTLDRTVVIIDQTGELGADTPDGRVVFEGASGNPSSTRSTYTLVLSKNPDGTRHVQALIDGKTIDIPQSAPGQKDTCLYQALQACSDVENKTFTSAENVDATRLISQVKQNTLKSNTLRQVYACGYDFKLDLEIGRNQEIEEKFRMGERIGKKHVKKYLAQGYQKVSGDSKFGQQGIDDVFFNPKTKHLVFVEYKYGSSKLQYTKTGKQMSKPWLGPRVDKAVRGHALAEQVRTVFNNGKFDKLLVQVKHSFSEKSGAFRHVVISHLDENANIKIGPYLDADGNLKYTKAMYGRREL